MAMRYPVHATHRGATITCRAQQVHVGGPPDSNLDHVTGYLRVDNWDTSSGHDWVGYVRVWSTVANKYWRAHGYMNADSWDRYHFSVWLHVPYPTATVHWRPHCSL
jgi:hypothetical protein